MKSLAHRPLDIRSRALFGRWPRLNDSWPCKSLKRFHKIALFFISYKSTKSSVCAYLSLKDFSAFILFAFFPKTLDTCLLILLLSLFITTATMGLILRHKSRASFKNFRKYLYTDLWNTKYTSSLKKTSFHHRQRVLHSYFLHICAQKSLNAVSSSELPMLTSSAPRINSMPDGYRKAVLLLFSYHWLFTYPSPLYTVQIATRFLKSVPMFFEAIAFLFNAELLTWMIMWMMRMGKRSFH